MTPPQQTPSKKRPPASGVAELRLQLAERDRRLADLTEQSLQILDRLAEAREGPSERASLHARIAELQELLADTRQRIRLGTRAMLGADIERSTEFEVVVWAIGGDNARLQATADGMTTPFTALLGPEDRVEAIAGLDARFSAHETDCRMPSYFWNEAMAMTQAPVVIMIAAGTQMAANDVARLAAAAMADGVAIASPLLDHAGARSLGRSERSLLDLVPQTTGLSGGDGVVAVPFASPEVFAVSRRAFEQLGSFDQDLLGDLALAEWVLRAGQRSLRCLGVAGAGATAAHLRDVGAESQVGESDRLVILARHRPQQLAAAALAANAFWQQEPMVVAATLRAIFRRLPQAAELSAAVDLLVVQAQTIAGWKRLAPALRERLLGVASEMRVPVGDAVSDPGLVTLAERLQANASVLRERSAELEVRNHEVHELRHQVELRDRLEQELRQDIIARSNTIDALRHELLERERAIASLREELGHRQGERDRLIDHLGNVQQDTDRLHDEVTKLSVANSELESDRNRVRTELGADLERVRGELGAEVARLRAELSAEVERRRDELETEVERRRTELAAEADRRRAEVDAVRVGHEQERAQLRAELARSQEQIARLQGEGTRVPDLEHKLAAELERSREIERQLGQAVGRTLELDPQLSEARHTLQQLEQMRAEESERLGSVLREIDDLRGGHENLRREHGSLQEQRVELEARAHELVLALRDRERWISSLLTEVQQRRLVRRELTPFEAEFLARHGQGVARP